MTLKELLKKPKLITRINSRANFRPMMAEGCGKA
jgi:hypothetical protein